MISQPNHMDIQKYTPSALLRPFIKEYVIIESNAELVNRVLPGTSLAIVFRFKGQINYIYENSYSSLPAFVVSGSRKSPRLINYVKDTAALIITFEDAGASTFFKEPLDELFGESISMDNFIQPQKIALIEEQLAEARNNRQRIVCIEQFLLSVINFKSTDKLIVASVQKIYASKGIVEIKSLADELCISLDAFEKRFRRTVGTTPKQFKVFTGQSPAEFFRMPALW